jgi:hypothetical protein
MYNNGDILFCSGTSAISEQIKQFTNSNYSHVGLIFNLTINDKRVTYVIEAIQPVISIIPLEQYFSNYKQSGKPYPGKLFIGRYKGGLSLEQSGQIFDSANHCVGLDYDSASIIKQAVNKIFGLSLEDKDAHRLICSELVGNAYAVAKINLPKDRHGFFTPASISRSEDLVIVELKG